MVVGRLDFQGNTFSEAFFRFRLSFFLLRRSLSTLTWRRRMSRRSRLGSLKRERQDTLLQRSGSKAKVLLVTVSAVGIF